MAWRTVYFGNENILSPLLPINFYYACTSRDHGDIVEHKKLLFDVLFMFKNVVFTANCFGVTLVENVKD